MGHIPSEGVSVAADFLNYPANVGTEQEFREGLKSQKYLGQLAWDARHCAEGGGVRVGEIWYPLSSNERMFFVHKYLTRIIEVCKALDAGKTSC